jgi:hypothetical protein
VRLWRTILAIQNSITIEYVALVVEASKEAQPQYNTVVEL